MVGDSWLGRQAYSPLVHERFAICFDERSYDEVRRIVLGFGLAFSTPLGPGPAQCDGQLLGDDAAVGESGLLIGRAELESQRFESVPVSGQLDRDAHILIAVGGDRFFQA